MLRYRQAVAMEPDNPNAQFVMGRFLVSRGRTSEALVHLKRAYALDPRHIGAGQVLRTLEGAPALGAGPP